MSGVFSSPSSLGRMEKWPDKSCFAVDAFCRQDVRTGKEKPVTDFVQRTVQ